MDSDNQQGFDTASLGATEQVDEDCPKLPACIYAVVWAMNEENNDLDRASRLYLLAGSPGLEAAMALEKAYRPTLPQFVAAEVCDELIRLRERLLQSAPGSDAPPVDAKAARKHVTRWLATALARDCTAFGFASDVLRICIMLVWKELERTHGKDWIAGLSEEQRRSVQVKPDAIYGDAFVEITGTVFQRAVSDFAQQVAKHLNVSEGPLERIDKYLGLQQTSGTSDSTRLPS